MSQMPTNRTLQVNGLKRNCNCQGEQPLEVQMAVSGAESSVLQHSSIKM